jgi:hypothetical protein
MQIELMWCQAVLKRWSEGPPDRPICEINIWQYPKDTRSRPYSPEEIQHMRDFLKSKISNTKREEERVTDIVGLK